MLSAVNHTSSNIKHHQAPSSIIKHHEAPPSSSIKHHQASSSTNWDVVDPSRSSQKYVRSRFRSSGSMGWWHSSHGSILFLRWKWHLRCGFLAYSLSLWFTAVWSANGHQVNAVPRPFSIPCFQYCSGHRVFLCVLDRNLFLQNSPCKFQTSGSCPWHFTD